MISEILKCDMLLTGNSETELIREMGFNLEVHSYGSLTYFIPKEQFRMPVLQTFPQIPFFGTHINEYKYIE